MANEKRLIDANALLSWLEECTGKGDWLVSQYNADWVWSMIDSAPTVDAVEVVRCKDCKYGEYDYTEYFDYYECHYIGGDWNRGDHFCAYGERKDNG